VSKLDPRQTLITLPNEIPWQVPDVAPPGSVAEAVLVGAEEQEGGDRPARDQEPLLRPPPERSVDLPLVRPAR